MGVEFELKFSATDCQQKQIRAAFPQSVQLLEMETTYYDTPDRALSNQRITLRRRFENGISVCTVKTPAGNARGEWDCVCDSIEEAIPELCKLGCTCDLQALTKNGVETVCGARFTRQALLLQEADFTAELALDAGVLTGSGRSIPLCEVELELKDGSPEALEAYGKAFAARFGLVPESRSKFRRAMDLAKGE